MPNLALLCLDLWQNLQKECALSLLILACKDMGKEKPIAQEIRNQFTLTDAARARFTEQAAQLSPRLGPLQEALADLPARRIDIMSRFARPSGIQSWYSSAFLLPLHALMTEALLSDPQMPPLQQAALLHLFDWALETIQIRDRVADQTGVPGWLDAPMLRTRLKPVIQKQLAYERLFFALADDQQKQTVATIKAGSSPKAIFCDELCAAILTDRTLPLLRDMPALEWFALFTAKSDMILTALRQFCAESIDERDAETALISLPLDADVENQLDLLRALPIFKGLAPLALASLLRPAKLVFVEKGETFLIQGGSVDKFYVLLDGWVKIFKSNVEGEEAILQILGKKEPLLDSGVLQSGPSPVSARAVTKARLLVLPLTTVREHLARHKELVTNFFAASSYRLARLSAHFEQITLRDAQARVCWFLLNLFREGGLEGRPLDLPYDKSLIAAFLNIKPETFSRVLQALKKEGFQIDKHQITMPHPRALCAYCDYDIAARCCNAESDECPRCDLRRYPLAKKTTRQGAA